MRTRSNFFEGGTEVGIAAEEEEGFEVGGEVSFEEVVDFLKEGVGGDFECEPMVTEGVLKEGADVL